MDSITISHFSCFLSQYSFKFNFLQIGLWYRQFCCWHFFPQYQTTLHLAHRSNITFSSSPVQGFIRQIEPSATSHVLHFALLIWRVLSVIRRLETWSSTLVTSASDLSLTNAIPLTVSFSVSTWTQTYSAFGILSWRKLVTSCSLASYGKLSTDKVALLPPDFSPPPKPPVPISSTRHHRRWFCMSLYSPFTLSLIMAMPWSLFSLLYM